MFQLAYSSLVLWVPIVYFVFERLPLQKAIVGSFVTAWLFLPPTAIDLPGFPDWTKATATVISVLLCTSLKRFDAYLKLRVRWFDLPVIVFCLCPFASSISANQGAYDGLSAVLDEVVRWGIPYLIGRAFLGDVAGNRLLCLGIALGGIAYIPICLFEIRMSPQLKQLIYSIVDGGGGFGLRYGGYRPMGFLSTGLELGWWMCCATLSAYMLWRSGAVRRVKDYPLGPILVILALVTLACKATGATLQLGLGVVAMHLATATKNARVLWPIMLIAPAYCIARPTGVWTGEAMVAMASDLFGADRAQSLAFRFDQEEGLMRFTAQRPIFGWARDGGFNAPDATGHYLTADGLWIIVFGRMGAVGLASLLAMLLVPAAIFVRKVRTSQWFHPDVAPVTALILIMALFMIDNLSNAMINPIYAIAMGSVSGYLARFSAAELGAAGSRGPGLLGPGSGDDPAVAAFEGRRYAAAIRHLDDELDELHRAFRRRPAADLLVLLARAHAFRARCYARLPDLARSVEEREYLLGLGEQYAHLLGRRPVDHPEFAGNLNDLAWALASPRLRDRDAVDRAVAHAAQVVEAHPGVGAYWNTLGVARYRSGDDLAAIQALSRSVTLSPGHGSPYDFYYLALANHRLGYRKPALAWLGRAEEAYAADPAGDPEIEGLRDEAATALQPD